MSEEEEEKSIEARKQKLPSVHEVISFLYQHLSMTTIAKLSDVPYTTLCTLKYKNNGIENNHCTLNTYLKLYDLYQHVKILEEDCEDEN